MARIIIQKIAIFALSLLLISSISCGRAKEKAELPQWFKLREENLDEKKARRLIKEYATYRDLQERYAEAYIVLRQYKKAAEIYEKLAEENISKSKLGFEDKTAETQGISFLAYAMNLHAKRICCLLITKGRNIGIRQLRKLYRDIARTLRVIEVYEDRVFIDGNFFSIKDPELIKLFNKTLEEPKDCLLDLRVDIEFKIRRLGYSPEDF